VEGISLKNKKKLSLKWAFQENIPENRVGKASAGRSVQGG